MPKSPPWEIKVARKAEVIAEFTIPFHKLQGNALKAFLKALVARYRSSDPEDMAHFYVNRRKGDPAYLPFAEIIRNDDLEQCRMGLFCGGWECYASATQKISRADAEAIKAVQDSSKAESSV